MSFISISNNETNITKGHITTFKTKLMRTQKCIVSFLKEKWVINHLWRSNVFFKIQVTAIYHMYQAKRNMGKACLAKRCLMETSIHQVYISIYKKISDKVESEVLTVKKILLANGRCHIGSHFVWQG